MCLAIPMRVISIDGDTIVAEIDGVKREASLMIIGEEIGVGDYVVVHAGFVISRMDEKEAQITLGLMKEMKSEPETALA
jgi:hydrogenase expression/formation protein HypC